MSAHMRRALLLAIVLAVALAAVPTYRMVGCDMDMGAMSFRPMHGLRFVEPCSGAWILRIGPLGAAPAPTSYSLLTLIAALVVGLLIVRPEFVSRPVFARVSNPPPPPEDPLGERFRV